MTPPSPPSSSLPPNPPVIGAPKNSKPIIALVLGILSLICCGLFAGIPAFFIGRSEVKAIDEGRGDPANRNIAQIGWILGLVGTILSVVGTIAYILVIVFALSGNLIKPGTF
ncbi:MAG TPA: DUF4190 domain-containing protein [Deltaproteobacteria bacterium]|nr:DUF4190 domain-containing protein [Deltaproteobacteria bacterium]